MIRIRQTESNVSEEESRFDVSGAFAIRVGGAAPELAGGFAGGAAAHGFAANGAQGYASLFSAGLNAGGVEAFGKKDARHLMLSYSPPFTNCTRSNSWSAIYSIQFKHFDRN